MRNTCRSCGERKIFPVLDLGATPIANALVELGSTVVDPVYPLALVGCGTCGLVQLDEDLPHGVIFDDTYRYMSSFSSSLMEHSRSHALSLIESRGLGADSFVIEVASNDGYLLRNFVEKGIRALGIEPSPLPAEAARKVGIETLEEFLGSASGLAIAEAHGTADVVLANNVLAHVPDINDFFEGLAALVADDGIICIENPQVRTLVDGVLFDTIYHEHYSYLSTTAIQHLGNRHGFHLNDVHTFPELHGGSLRWTLSRRPDQTPEAKRFLAEEAEVDLTSPAYFEEFAGRVGLAQESLRAVLADLKKAGKRIAAYGCAAKGATLLNSAGIDHHTIDYVVDLNPGKQGQMMPGCRLECRSPEALETDRPEILLILAWNFAPEIMQQERAFHQRGGRFLVPLPEPTFLEPG